jgi:16S rRNA (uracil1498-N3)-methyltransferase
MNIFYCPDAALNEHCLLDEVESRHIATVLRKQEGEELFVFDGKGKLFDARIDSISKKEVAIHVVRLIRVEENRAPNLHIAIAPSKNIERLEWFAEKATELGITEITPLLCKHSERKSLRQDRIEKIVLGACKQSMNLTLPKLNPMTSFNDFVKSPSHENRKFIAHSDEKALHLKEIYHGGFDVSSSFAWLDLI